MQSNTYFSERIVAFIDILGFKNLVEQSVCSPAIAEKLHKSLQIIYEQKRDNENIEGIGLKDYGVEVTTFSDSIVISYPINYEGGLFFVLLDVIHLQLQLACQGILIRGGISIGPLYHNGEIVYGPAMNEAYMLESQYAVVPRVIIDERTLKTGICKTCAAHHTIGMEVEYVMSCVRRDAEDDRFYLDMLRQEQELVDYGDEYYSWLKSLRRMIVDGLNQNTGNPRVYEKYKWLRKYYNEVVADNVAYYPVPECGKTGMNFRKAYADLRIKRRKHAGGVYM